MGRGSVSEGRGRREGKGRKGKGNSDAKEGGWDRAFFVDCCLERGNVLCMDARFERKMKYSGLGSCSVLDV